MQVDTEQLLANAARFLHDSQSDEAVRLVLACSSCALEEVTNWGRTEVYVTLAGPRVVYETLRDQQNPVTEAVKDAFAAVLPPNLDLRDVVPRVELSPVDAEWRTQLLGQLEGRSIDNQGVERSDNQPLKLWKDLRFRSASETRIAEALDRAQVLFLPNCKARLGRSARQTREADFLVCLDGKWGILEVDGEPFHPASRTVHDHQRDRLFKAHGILVVEHFDAAECFERADAVVRKFLEILGKA